jgi:hypothetical protein
VYDAINVLTAMGIIIKVFHPKCTFFLFLLKYQDRKSITWKGFSNMKESKREALLLAKAEKQTVKFLF